MFKTVEFKTGNRGNPVLAGKAQGEHNSAVDHPPLRCPFPSPVDCPSLGPYMAFKHPHSD